jgi:carbon monoxide dehydrogenase subunit G
MARARIGRMLAATAVFAAIAGVAGAADAPSVVVSADHGAGLVSGSVEVHAAPQVVWRVMVDPANTPKLMAGAKSCRIIQRDPAGRWDVREQYSRGGVMPSVRIVLRSDYEPYSRVAFHRIDGDIPVLDGEWRLTPLDGGAGTRIDYANRVTSPFPAPGPLVRAILRKDTLQTLAALREASEAAARVAPP